MQPFQSHTITHLQNQLVKMHSSISLAILFLTIATAAAAAKEYQVGDTVGWRVPATNETELYTTWASRRRFHIGDSLRFRYSSGSVVVVDKHGFYHCDPSHPVSYFNDGNTLVSLDKGGTHYFISGELDRCHQGQKMILTVKYPRHPSIADAPQSSYDAVAPSPAQVSGLGPSSVSGSAVLVSASVMAYIVAVAGIGLCLA